MRLGLEAGADTLEAAVELGIGGVPVKAADLVDKGVDATLAPLRDRGLQVCQIGAFGFNPLSDDRDAQAVQDRILREAIPLAAETGCPYIVICGGNHHPSGFGALMDYVGAAKAPLRADAVDDLIARARASTPDDPLYVVAIAAISNVASALLAAPDIADRIVVVWLGGHALHWPHTREFNLRQDVGGAQVLFDSAAPLVHVPCEGVTTHLTASSPEIERYVAPHGAIGAFLAQRFMEYSDDLPGWSKEIWDMATIAWLVNPDWCPSVICPRPILTSEVTWSVDAARGPMRYVYHMHRDPIFRDFFAKLAAHAQQG